MTMLKEPKIGDYVLATKYADGDPGDPWALGIYAGTNVMADTRHMVNNSDGFTIRPNGYRKCHPIRKDVGRWLLTVAADQLEKSPPGTVNLWTMLTPNAFDLEIDTEPTPRHTPQPSEQWGILEQCGDVA